jgi:hypothetical protein
MRTLIGFALLFVMLCGCPAPAQDNPSAGTWKLNAERSRLNGPLPAFVHDGVMKISLRMEHSDAHSARQ